MNDELLSFLADDDFVEDSGPSAPPWLILVVDDDPEIHAVTRLALRRFEFAGREIELLNAFSARQAEMMLRQRPDVAVILLDVVMEQEDAGLRLVRVVREVLGNVAVRIILRTGQPGQAPERTIITECDINDYRAKTELTQDRLYSCIVSALRSFQVIKQLEANNQGMARIIDATPEMFHSDTMHRCLDFALTTVLDLMGDCPDGVFCALQRDPIRLVEDIVVVEGFGRFSAAVDQLASQVLEPAEVAAIAAVIRGGSPVFTDHTILYLGMNGRWSGAMYLPKTPRDDATRQQLLLLSRVINAALSNFLLLSELRRSNKATVVALADLAEHRDTDTGEHVLRVAHLTTNIARELQMSSPYANQIDDLFLESIGLASMLHDVGKVGVPDTILKKPGRLDPTERIKMESHTVIGAETLEKAKAIVCNSSYLDLGWQVAIGHHEWFNGQGYPNHLKGEEISLAARIVAVADVFDALTTPRVYKAAWSLEEAVNYVVGRAGTQFDPVIVQAFRNVMAKVLERTGIQWTPEMSVHHPQLDADHQRLVKLVNQVAAANSSNDRQTLEFALDELVHYARMHFAREVVYMETIGYPDIKRHIQEHSQLINQLTALRSRLLNGLPSRISTDVIEFLNQWLFHHILVEDRDYTRFQAAPLKYAKEPALFLE